jgi:hypothetical protein
MNMDMSSTRPLDTAGRGGAAIDAGLIAWPEQASIVDRN